MLLTYFLLLLCNQSISTQAYLSRQFPTPAQREDQNYWNALGKAEIDRALLRYAKLRGQSITEALAATKHPKNIILFVGDGMSLATVAAARILKGQKYLNVSGEEQYLAWERFTESALLKTYNTDKQTGDSAATAVALFSGVKTIFKTLGFDSKIKFGKPSSHVKAEKLHGVLHWAQELGMKTGFVTNTRLTHATPAALYAHVANRDWECDAFINRKKVHASEKVPEPGQVLDIARQLIESSPGNRTDVILGGGLAAFKTTNSAKSSQWVCSREDGINLIETWRHFQHQNGFQHRFITNSQGLQDAVRDKPEKLLGIFAQSHLSFDYKKPENQPSLSELTQAAIQLLDHQSQGFFLMVEGGRIDHAHHQSYANLALEETLALEKAVEQTMNLLDSKGIEEETLVIVTADHSHTMVLPGYPLRGSDIKGFLGVNEVDQLPELPMIYGNGPRAPTANDYQRLNFSNEDIAAMKFVYPALIPRYEESHASDDVGLWATGPMSFLFHSTHEQSYVGQVMAFSLCMGHFQDTDYCLQRKMSQLSNSTLTPIIILSSCCILVLVFVYFCWRSNVEARRSFSFV